MFYPGRSWYLARHLGRVHWWYPTRLPTSFNLLADEWFGRCDEDNLSLGEPAKIWKTGLLQQEKNKGKVARVTHSSS